MSIEDEMYKEQELEQPTPEASEQMEPARPSWKLPEWVKAQTGAGEITDYLNHALNFNHSRPLAQLIRGLTGMFGAMNYAVIDIGMGLLGMSRNKRPVPPPAPGDIARTWEGSVAGD